MHLTVPYPRCAIAIAVVATACASPDSVVDSSVRYGNAVAANVFSADRGKMNASVSSSSLLIIPGESFVLPAYHWDYAIEIVCAYYIFSYRQRVTIVTPGSGAVSVDALTESLAPVSPRLVTNVWDCEGYQIVEAGECACMIFAFKAASPGDPGLSLNTLITAQKKRHATTGRTVKS